VSNYRLDLYDLYDSTAKAPTCVVVNVLKEVFRKALTHVNATTARQGVSTTS